MLNRLKNKFNIVSQTLNFLIINIYKINKLPKIKSEIINGNLILTALKKNEILKIKNEIRFAFKKCSKPALILYFLFNHKIVFTLRDDQKNILAYLTFYFNKDDINNNTIHASNLVVPFEYRNLGYGAIIEQIAFLHFEKKTNLSGITSRIKIKNKNALIISKYNGFIIKKQYINCEGAEEAYLLKKFQQ